MYERTTSTSSESLHVPTAAEVGCSVTFEKLRKEEDCGIYTVQITIAWGSGRKEITFFGTKEQCDEVLRGMEFPVKDRPVL